MKRELLIWCFENLETKYDPIKAIGYNAEKNEILKSLSQKIKKIN